MEQYAGLLKFVECFKCGSQEKSEEIARGVQKCFSLNGYQININCQQNSLLNPGFLGNVCAKNKNAVKDEIIEKLNLHDDTDTAIKLSENVINAVAEINSRFAKRDDLYDSLSRCVHLPLGFLAFNENKDDVTNHLHELKQQVLQLGINDPDGVDQIKKRFLKLNDTMFPGITQSGPGYVDNARVDMYQNSRPRFNIRYKIGICGTFTIYQESLMAQKIQQIGSELCLNDYTACDVIIFDNIKTYLTFKFRQDLKKDCSCVNVEWLNDCFKFNKLCDFEKKYTYSVELTFDNIFVIFCNFLMMYQLCEQILF